MGVLAFVEDRPTPKAVYNWRVYTAAAVASWASCMIGYDSAFIGTTLALPSFVNEFRLNDLEPADLARTKANIVSVYQAGAFFGSFGAYASSYYLGRKKSLFIWVLVFILGAGMMLGANSERGLGLIIGGRVLAGLGVGGASNMVPIYISELSPPAARVDWLAYTNLVGKLAVLLAFGSTTGFRRQWHPPELNGSFLSLSNSSLLVASSSAPYG